MQVTLLFLCVSLIFIPVGIVLTVFGLDVRIAARGGEGWEGWRSRGLLACMHAALRLISPPRLQAHEIKYQYDQECLPNFANNIDRQNFLWAVS
jgi:hypothetical protein